MTDHLTDEQLDALIAQRRNECQYWVDRMLPFDFDNQVSKSPQYRDIQLFDALQDRLRAARAERDELHSKADHYVDKGAEWERRYYAQQAELAAARELLAEIRPMAAWESCMYTNRFNTYQRSIGVEPQFADSDPNIAFDTHCCDWNEVVEKIDALRQGSGEGASDG